ncbi:MAG TPA: YbaK/EbsC family protein [Candidatus Dojkabacteria bacterium]|nr:YbaK/EbsC family protein [Candidatus Dojkabacteria bacterium]
MAIEVFSKFIKDYDLDINIIVSDESTHTVQEAASVHGVPVSNIVKSLLVKIDNNFALFLVSGDKRLDLEELKNVYSTKNIRMASADEVKEMTGYSIGGVPPFGHKNKLMIYIQSGFDESNDVVAAAGSNNAVFRISFKRLKEIVEKVNGEFKQ